MWSEQSVLTARNQAASVWMHRGMALAEQESRADLVEAVLCFDEAITLRLTLPLAENPWFRYGLSAGWINRADALVRLAGAEGFAGAIVSYDAALVLLRDVPLADNVLYPRRLAITWINRGIALQKREAAGFTADATRCFEEALGVLAGTAAASLEDGPRLRTVAWSNLAGVRLLDSDRSSDGVRDAVRAVLLLAKASAQEDITVAQASLQARQTLCRLTVQHLVGGGPLPEGLGAESVEAAVGGMELARHWEARGQTGLREAADSLFVLGCRVYQQFRPLAVADFVVGCLAPMEGAAALPWNAAAGRAAVAAVWGVAGQIQQEDFGRLAQPMEQARALEIVRALRDAEERLHVLARRSISMVPAA